ncbi:MAG: ribosome biogenesis GTPase Der [Pseudomonadota bacterium]
MKPVFALIGRPNVGKSTLFNKLTRTRDALVADLPGLTRDRQYGDGSHDGHEFIVIDTGGLSGEKDELDQQMAQQTLMAIEDADTVLFMVDGRNGLSPADEELAVSVRRFGKPVVVVVNKIDGLDDEKARTDFYALGFESVLAIAAAHNRGVHKLINHCIENVVCDSFETDGSVDDDHKTIRVAIVGRPNAGKSTLINRLLDEERVVANSRPGTTRDSVAVNFTRNNREYTLIDTAGVRKKSKVSDTVEKFSVIKTLQAIDQSHVSVLLIDVTSGIGEQDLHLIDYIVTKGRALVIAFNKSDALKPDQKHEVKLDIERRLTFASFAKIHFISALKGNSVGKLVQSVNSAYRAAMSNMTTSELTRMLEYAIQQHQPPLVNGRRIKLRYAHQGGSNPPIIVIHGNQTDRVPNHYKRYLNNFFIDALKLEGTPLRIELKSQKNPFASKSTRIKRRPKQDNRRTRS